MKRDFKDEIDIELTSRCAQAYADEHGIEATRFVIVVPDCNCNAGLDDTTDDLKCPVCGKLGVRE